MEMCDRKYIFGDKSTFGSAKKMVKTYPKKVNKKLYFFCKLNKGHVNLPSLKSLHFTFPLKTFFEGVRE